MNDVMGHPLEVGTKVLTPAHCSTAYTEVATIDKVTRRAVYVNLYCQHWDREKGTFIEGMRSLRRRPDQMVAIAAQHRHNKKNYPENLI